MDLKIVTEAGAPGRRYLIVLPEGMGPGPAADPDAVAYHGKCIAEEVHDDDEYVWWRDAEGFEVPTPEGVEDIGVTTQRVKVESKDTD